MPPDHNYFRHYEIRRILLFGSAGGGGLIFSVLILLFLNARISQGTQHPPISTDTVSEMSGYAEFFLFALSSYFASALFVWWRRNWFSKFVVSWLPIALLGSLAFSASFLSMVWFSSRMTYKEGDPFQSPPGTFWNLILSVLVYGLVSFFIASISCSLVSAFVDSEKQDNRLLH